ncbi:MAG: hypothetical protein EXS31_04285 [Pedosphaera sp.]|nr:hypothetical protein [Pedosphaera sp.]
MTMVVHKASGTTFDVQGVTEAVVLVGSEITEPRAPADRVAVSQAAETKAIQVQSNQITDFATEVERLYESVLR